MKTKNVLLAVMLACTLGLVAQADEGRIGSDADTHINGSTPYGNEVSMYIRQGERAGYLRFDLGAINVNTVLDAQLILVNAERAEGNQAISLARFALWGLNNVAGNTPQDWNESTFTAAASGLEWTGTAPNPAEGRLTDLDDTVAGMTISIVEDPALDYWVTGKYTFTISGQPLIDFLQARADDDGLATFIIAHGETSGGRKFGIAAKEHTNEAIRPVLVLTYITGGASNPQPADGTTITDLNLPQLCWDNMNVAAADVWFGAGAGSDVNQVNYRDYLTRIGYVATPAETSCMNIPAAMLPLAVPETYYWVVDAYGYPASDPNHLGEPNALLSNTLWTFSTSSIPVAQTAPANQIKRLGETASFSVQFLALTPVIDAVWYRNGSPVDTGDADVTVSISDDGSGLYTVTLTIEDLTSADEGIYGCVAINSGGPSLLSNIADLRIKRLLAQYAFDENLDDSSSNGAPSGIAMDTLGNPNSLEAVPATISYVAGVDGTSGGALYLDPNEYIDFGVNGYPRAGDFTNGTNGGLDEGTIVFWVKPNVGNVQQTILGNFNDGTPSGNTTGFLALLLANQNFDLYIRGSNSAVLTNHVAGRPNRPGFNLTDGNWHMMAACWSGNTCTLYVDGQWVVSRTDSTPTSYAAWQRGMLLGATRTSANRDNLADMFRGGAIDNLRIYNYRLDNAGVDAFAQEYLDHTGVRPCINMSFAGNNFNFVNTGSSYCKIDLADFAAFAAAWLANGLY
jgi:hypothetical protein